MSTAYNADETAAHDANARAKELQHEAVEERKLEAQGVLRKDRHPGKLSLPLTPCAPQHAQRSRNARLRLICCVARRFSALGTPSSSCAAASASRARKAA